MNSILNPIRTAKSTNDVDSKVESKVEVDDGPDHQAKKLEEPKLEIGTKNSDLHKNQAESGEGAPNASDDAPV